MHIQSYMPLVIQVILAIGVGGAILFISALLGQRSKSTVIKEQAYECGLPSEGKIHPRFFIRFYLVAILFILFDVEVVVLIPWVTVYRELVSNGISIVGPTLFFIGLMFVGLLYETSKGVLNWNHK